MYIYRNLPISLVWRFGWINFIIFIAWGSLVYLMHGYHPELELSFTLLSAIGVGVSIYLSFKNSQSYDRQWEARKIWGELSGKSKILYNQSSVYIKRDDMALYTSELKILIYRQLAFLNACRLHLRKPAAHSRKYSGLLKVYYYGSPSENDWEMECSKFLDLEEFNNLKHAENRPLYLLNRQYEHLYRLRHSGDLDEFRQMDMNKTLDACTEAIGKCERIKNTPFPRQYAFFSKTFVWIFVCLLPFGLLGQLQGSGITNYIYFTGLNLLISWVFITMELVADFSEDPFENFVSDIPMTAICRQVERDLKSLLGESSLPDKAAANLGYMM